MGEVYKATDTRLDRTVAVKVISDRIAGDAELHARFEREARAVALLDHPHICAVYLMSTPIDDGDRPAITVVLNWPALLKK